MTNVRQLPAVCPPQDDGGLIEAACDIVNQNAAEQAALQGVMEAGRRADARQQARQRRRQLRRTLQDIGLVTAGAGAVFVGLAITGGCPWWISIAAILVAQAMFYAARRL